MKTLVLLAGWIVLLTGPFIGFSVIWSRMERNADSFWGAVMASIWVMVLWMFLFAQMMVVI